MKAMNWDQIQGDWKQFSGKVKEKWGKLTDNELTTTSGKREQLIGVLQERYGYAPVAESTPELPSMQQRLSVCGLLQGTFRQPVNRRRSRQRPIIESLEVRLLPAVGFQLLKDINDEPNRDFVFTQASIVSGETLFVSGFTRTLGTELWKSDGTVEGTVLVKDIVVGGFESKPSQFARSDSLSTDVPVGIFFLARDSEQTYALWKSDGSQEGTTLVYQFATRNEDDIRHLTSVNGRLFFTLSDVLRGNRELWISDGTAAGTRMVTDLEASYSGSDPQELVDVNGILYFTADVTGSGRELWKSDGTEAGTVLVKDIYPGGLGSFRYGSTPTGLVAGNGMFYFFATNSTNGRELWKSDGTEAGTVMVKDIVPGSASSQPTLTPWTRFDGTDLYFSADDSVHGQELWKSDGTTAGTSLVKDIRPGNSGSNPARLTSVDGTLFFSADDGVHGGELWQSDGTELRTTLVHDTYPGILSSNPRPISAVNGQLMFAANDGVHGSELWTSDGTATGTRLVLDIMQGSQSSGISIFNVLGGKLTFVASDGVHASQLWISDGTATGTSMLRNIPPGSGSSDPSMPVDLNGQGIFTATNGQRRLQLWKTDGTPERTSATYSNSAVETP